VSLVNVAVVIVTDVETMVLTVAVVVVVVSVSVSVDVYTVSVLTIRGVVVATTVEEVVVVDTTVARGIARKLEQNGVAQESFNNSTMASTAKHSCEEACRSSIGEDRIV
jgi:hypothetical protein